ncbi:DUF397 domain-containing protein [Streptomyces sp. CAU 1734]|uniref:DUF397 domain-containing protein n=1 Tax=Streptomyces sp. CAU 1734 TaxID=3140360 RepID=UPI00326184E7
MAEESAWFKSSYSNNTGGNCVEVAALTGAAGVRDSKTPEGPALVVPSGAWHRFVGFAADAATT